MTPSVARVLEAPRTEWLQDARAGSADALGQLFEACRPYLLAIARQELRASMQAKVDAADVVQETFIEAQRDFAAFRGETGPQFLGWLRGILRHNVADLTRRYETSCRCLSQEVRLPGSLGRSARRGPSFVNGMSVCEQLIAQERQCALVAAVQRLPLCYRQVLQFRHDDRQSFAEIGLRLHRSPEAVRNSGAALWSVYVITWKNTENTDGDTIGYRRRVHSSALYFSAVSRLTVSADHSAAGSTASHACRSRRFSSSPDKGRLRTNAR